MNSDSTGWTLGTIWAAIRRWWILIVALAILGAGGAYGAAMTVTPVYQSQASLFFALSQGSTVSDLNQGSTYTQNQMLSFANLAESSRVLQPVIDELGLDTTPSKLAQDVEVSIPQQTVVLEVQVSSTSAELAAELANAIAASLTDAVSDVASVGGPDDAPTIAAQVIDEAVVPQFQALPNKSRDAALGGVVGLLVGLAAAILISFADTRLRTEANVAQVSGLPALGALSRLKDASGLAVAREPLGSTAEEFRRICSALSYASADQPQRLLLVTSSLPGEGKSFFAANLALTLATSGHRVLLIDADLRRPRVDDYFGYEGAVGLSGVLVGDITLEDAVLQRSETSLSVLTSGRVPPSPPELLSSEAMRDLLQRTSEQFEYVIVDSPPVLSVADANLLTPLVDGTIVVVDASRTRKAQLTAAMKSLSATGAHLVGSIANRVKVTRRRTDYYSESD